MWDTLYVKGNIRHKSSATHPYRSVLYFCVSKQWCGCQCLGFLVCPQMLMHTVTAHRGCSDTGGEHALKFDQGRKFFATPGKWTRVSTVPGFPVWQSTCWAILLPLSGTLSCLAGGPLPKREREREKKKKKKKRGGGGEKEKGTENVQQQEIEQRICSSRKLNREYAAAGNWTENVQQQEIEQRMCSSRKLSCRIRKEMLYSKATRYQNELWAGSIFTELTLYSMNIRTAPPPPPPPHNWTEQVNVACHSFLQE